LICIEVLSIGWAAMAGYLLGIDNGGTVSKVALFDLDGREVAIASRKVATAYPRPGWVERSMEDVWQSTAGAIRDVLEQSGIAPGAILAVGNTGHGNGVYLLDETGEPLCPAPLSVDQRAAGIVSGWEQAGITARIWEIVCQQSWAGQVLPLLGWFKQYMPETYGRIGHVLLCKDFIKYRLTGVISTDPMDMSGTGLFDVRRRAYAGDVLEVCGLAEVLERLPAVAACEAIIGRVTQGAAALTGLMPGTPVVAGIFDVSACALSAGVLEPGQACIVAGTWSINEVVTAEVIDHRDLFMNSVYVPGRFMLLEASPTSASNLEWYVTQLGAAEAAEASTRGVSVYAVCNAIVERTPETSVLFHPFLFGSNVGGNARAGFYGVGGWHTRDHLLRAVYEGIVYTHLSHLDKLRRCGVVVNSARLTGGGARSPVWAQMFADALQIPIEVVQGEEMGARGAALCAGIGAGVYRDYADAARQVVQVERRFELDAGRTSYYQERYRVHQRLGEALRESWEAMAGWG
jgi:L-xylulokinase